MPFTELFVVQAVYLSTQSDSSYIETVSWTSRRKDAGAIERAQSTGTNTHIHTHTELSYLRLLQGTYNRKILRRQRHFRGKLRMTGLKNL